MLELVEALEAGGDVATGGIANLWSRGAPRPALRPPFEPLDDAALPRARPARRAARHGPHGDPARLPVPVHVLRGAHLLRALRGLRRATGAGARTRTCWPSCAGLRDAGPARLRDLPRRHLHHQAPLGEGVLPRLRRGDPALRSRCTRASRPSTRSFCTCSPRRAASRSPTAWRAAASACAGRSCAVRSPTALPRRVPLDARGRDPPDRQLHDRPAGRDARGPAEDARPRRGARGRTTSATSSSIRTPARTSSESAATRATCRTTTSSVPANHRESILDLPDLTKDDIAEYYDRLHRPAPAPLRRSARARSQPGTWVRWRRAAERWLGGSSTRSTPPSAPAGGGGPRTRCSSARWRALARGSRSCSAVMTSPVSTPAAPSGERMRRSSSALEPFEPPRCEWPPIHCCTGVAAEDQS